MTSLFECICVLSGNLNISFTKLLYYLMVILLKVNQERGFRRGSDGKESA